MQQAADFLEEKLAVTRMRFFDEFPTTSGGSARRAELARRVRRELAARNGGETAPPPDA